MSSTHPKIKAAAAKADAKLEAAAPKIAAASPSTSSAVLTLFKTVFLPMLAPIIGALITKYGGSKLKTALEPVRDILNAAYPPE